MEAKSGVRWNEATAALARLYLGDDADENTARLNAEISITMATQGESLKQEATKVRAIRSPRSI